MEWLMNNWFIVVGLVALVVFVVYLCVRFFNMPTKQQIACVKELLKYWVMEAEAQLGSGTGQAKLELVYYWFTSQFKWASVVPFETFSKWVDEALVWLNQQLETNANIKKLVKAESK